MQVYGRKIRQLIRPLLPAGLLALAERQRQLQQRKYEDQRRAMFEHLRHNVTSVVQTIASLTPNQCRDVSFLEHQFIPSLGLNDEKLDEQPAELTQYFGKGLHVWQYPNQLARYLNWLSANSANVKSYMEIGCRWGGMVILVAEWLRKNGARLEYVVAVDPIEQTPLIDEYFKLLQSERSSGKSQVRTKYLQEYSTSGAVAKVVEEVRPDFVFVDGDHSLKVALADHMLARKYAKIVVHHDISSDACDTAFLWAALKSMESAEFEMAEFTDQYESVAGYFFGIGVMKRRRTTG
jgi:cephalosporin hydroxylase